VRYAGSDDDSALNAAVERFGAEPKGVRDLAYDSDLSGMLTVPTLTMHAEDDPTAFVELESKFQDTADRLVTFGRAPRGGVVLISENKHY
jgi:hypothetical protein